MKNKDLETFKNNKNWIFKNQSIEIADLDIKIDLPNTFTNHFPNLTLLIQSARILNLKIDDKKFRLFSWDNKKKESFGWLIKLEDIYSNENNIIEEHNLLLENLGGIVETYNDPENSLTNNQNFIFLKSKCQTGLKNWEYYYEEIVDDQKCQKIDYKKLTIFAEEANGNLTLYDKIRKEVFLFAPDHSFSNVIKIDNQPEYSFYKFSKIQNFNDYVETISKQWILNTYKNI